MTVERRSDEALGGSFPIGFKRSGGLGGVGRCMSLICEKQEDKARQLKLSETALVY